MGVNQKIHFIYNTYYQPVGIYGLGTLKVKNKTIIEGNIIQNNLIRHMLDIPYKSQIKRVSHSIIQIKYDRAPGESMLYNSI